MTLQLQKDGDLQTFEYAASQASNDSATCENVPHTVSRSRSFNAPGGQKRQILNTSNTTTSNCEQSKVNDSDSDAATRQNDGSQLGRGSDNSFLDG